MLGLFKKNTDVALVEREFKKEQDKLIALLQADLKLIEQEKQKIEQALQALRRANPKKRDLMNIKARLELIHQNILWADKLAGEETSHAAAESTTLDDLRVKVDQILALAHSQKK